MVTYMNESQQRVESRIADYDAKIASHLARTWEEDDPEITVSTREAAELLGMSAAEVWRIMEVWSLVSGRQAARHRLDRIVSGVSDCR